MSNWESKDNLADAVGEISSDGRWPSNPESRYRVEKTTGILAWIDGELCHIEKYTFIGVDGVFFSEDGWVMGGCEETNPDLIIDEDFFGPGYPVCVSNNNLKACSEICIGDDDNMEWTAIKHGVRQVEFISGTKIF